MRQGTISDVVLILDDDLDRLIERPRQQVSSVRTMVHLIHYILRLRDRLSGHRQRVHSVLLEVAAERGIGQGAIGPIHELVDRYGDSAVDDPEVLDLLRTWITRSRS